MHRNIINFACKKGSVGNTQLLPRAKMLLFPMSFFCSGGGSVIFAAYFILRGRDVHIDFLRLLFLVGVRKC